MAPVLSQPGDGIVRFFVRYVTSGEVFAAETLQYETLRGLAGPLYYRDIRPELLDSYEYETFGIGEIGEAEWADDDVWRGPLEDTDPVFGDRS